MKKKQNLRLAKPVTKSSEKAGKHHLRARIRLRIYLGSILVSLLLICGIIWSRAYQHLNLSMIVVSNDSLQFEPSHEITQWHHNEAKFVYLTFNDGPSKNTELILDVLDNHDVKGTFFVLGSAIEKLQTSEEILRKIIENDHYIGLHSMTRNVNYLYLDDDAAQNFLDEMLALQEVVALMTQGFESTLCRAPLGTSGNLSEQHVKLLLDSGLNCWDWHIDARDWSPVTVEDVMTHIETGMMLWGQPNHMVILFQESDVAIESLPQVIAYFLENGYEFLAYDPIRHVPVNLINHPDL